MKPSEFIEDPVSIEARKLTICPGCGKPKSVGIIVCWTCFKYIDNPFKYADMPLKDWLKTIPVTDFQTKIARSGL